MHGALAWERRGSEGETLSVLAQPVEGRGFRQCCKVATGLGFGVLGFRVWRGYRGYVGAIGGLYNSYIMIYRGCI